jgi:hypothetical protein
MRPTFISKRSRAHKSGPTRPSSHLRLGQQRTEKKAIHGCRLLAAAPRPGGAGDGEVDPRSANPGVEVEVSMIRTNTSRYRRWHPLGAAPTKSVGTAVVAVWRVPCACHARRIACQRASCCTRTWGARAPRHSRRATERGSGARSCWIGCGAWLTRRCRAPRRRRPSHSLRGTRGRAARRAP